MGLSYDLISEFVKITNDKKENTKEGTVYATVVSGTDGKYVQIDGSDLLTPMDTTTDIEDGERVTLMIKDHKAIVTGNVTTPSASTSKVDKVTESINSVSDRVGTFELVVADKISTKELEAYKATIEVLIAKKATIEDLTATNAKIENLEVKNAEIENLVAEKATITDLEAVNATIENLKATDAEIENAVVENLKATTADIKILNADFAQIKTLVNGNLTSDNILSFNLTSGKVTVDDAFIKDAMIDTISAGKINAGKINTNSVSIGSEDGGMLITGSTQQFMDKNGNVRIQIGKDASGDFTFVLYGEDGKGQLINQNGITASAIGDGLIVNDMVSDHAAISGGKLDISSVITEINSDNSTTIKSSKIYLNDQAQSLEVAFNSLKTRVDTIQEVTIQGDLTAIVEQVQSNTSKIEANKNSINTLISEDTVIKKQVTDLQGTLNETETTLNSKYTALNQNLDGFKTTVADTYATKKSVTDVVDNIETNYSTTSVMNSAIEQKAQEISASVSSTYATKNEVSTLDNNLKTNYSTTKEMESAINVAKEEINLGVSSIYETKENVTTKINNIKVGGRNYLINSDFSKAEKNSVQAKNPDLYPVGWGAYNGSISNPTTSYHAHIDKDTFGYNVIEYNESDGNRNWKGIIQGELQTRISTSGTFTFSVDMYATGSGTKLWGGFYYCLKGQTSPNFHSGQFNIASADIPVNKWGRRSIKCQLGDNVEFSKGITFYVYGYGFSSNSILYIKNVKLEFGNKATDWQNGMEDTKTDIQNAKTEAIKSANNTLTSTISNYYTKAQTDSQINIAKEEINLGVSTKYETKTNVQSKVTSTLNSAKSYADTKKTEAISTAASDATTKANTAKQEAITSANNNTSTVIKNYYTKAQTDSQINIAKEAINLGVSTTYETKENVTTKINNINVGSVNRFTGTNKPFTMNINNPTNYSVWDTYFTPNKQTLSELGFKVGDQVTVGFKWEISKNGTNNFVYGNFRSEFVAADRKYVGVIKSPVATFSASNTKGRSEATVTLNEKSLSAIGLRIRIDNSVLTLTISDVKMEKGNKATSWSPAPEDVKNDISTAKTEAITSANNTLTTTISNYYTKSQTDSQINIAKEAINLGVSNTYETKKNVETKVTSTLNSAKSYADTKKTEAISTAASDATTKANKAKSDAITSANNNTSNVIKNYYTKEQTDSQINVAKNAITQSVSSTYATKTNVTSSINGVNNSINSLTTRMKSAESKITDTAITNTVKKNFYTKTETENAIASKGYATQSQVQQTANDISFKFSQSGGYNLIRNGNPKPHNYEHWWVSGNGWWWLGSPADIGIGTTDANEAYAGSATFKLQPNCDYSFSCWVYAESNTKGADIYFIGSSKDDRAYEDIHHLFNGGKDGWTKVEATFTTGPNTQYGFIRIDNNGALDTSGHNVVFFSDVQLTKGSHYYPQWSPNPNEVYDGITTIDKDGVRVSASNINGYTHITNLGFFVNNGGKDVVSIDKRGLQLFDAKIQLTHANGNKYFLLDENGIIMYNPANGTHQWGKVAAINNKFTIASNGNSSGLSLGHHVNENYVEDILCDSYGYLTVYRQMNHNGIYYNNYGQIFIRQSGQSGWEITGRSDSHSIKPGGANQGSLGSNTQYINNSWVAIRNNPSSIEVKHVSHYVEDNECISLVNGVKPARYFYKEYDEEGNDITTFTTKSSQLGLIYEDVRECSARDLITNEEDKGINLYSMISVLWGATRNVNTRLNDAEYEIVLLKEEIEQLKNKLGEK